MTLLSIYFIGVAVSTVLLVLSTAITAAYKNRPVTVNNKFVLGLLVRVALWPIMLVVLVALLIVALFATICVKVLETF